MKKGPAHLVNRIRQLEQELAEAKAKAAMADRAPPLSPTDDWLIDTVRYVLTRDQGDVVIPALAQLGRFLDLIDCSLWRLNENTRQAEKLGSWQAKPLAELGTDPWLGLVLADKAHAWPQLSGGRTLVVKPQGPTAALSRMLKQCGADQSALLPITTDRQVRGFIALHRAGSGAWHDRELALGSMLGDILIAVTDRRQLLHELETRETRFRYAMEASRDGLWDWDMVSGEVYYSHSYRRMLGYQDEPVPPTIDTFKDRFLFPEDAETVLGRFREALNSGAEHFNLEFRLRHKSGHPVWVYCRAKLFEPDETGRPTRCVGINADISDFVQTHDQLVAAKTQADMANRTKDDFLARMSHDLRTPLNAIVGLGNLLGHTDLDERQRGYVDSLNTAADSLLHIINQLLDFSKLETGQIQLENAHFDLELVLERLSRRFEVSAYRRDIELIYDIEPNVPRFLRGDAARLNQVLGNLVQTAIEHCAGKRLLITVSRIKKGRKAVRLAFGIPDFCTGMAQEQLDSLLAAVNDQDNHPVTSDIGFDLNVCRHLIELMGGTLRIDTEPKGQCSLEMTARFEHSHMGAKALRTQPHQFDRLKALIVDDDALAREILCKTLQGMRLCADSVPDAHAALEQVRRADEAGQAYQLILMDYKMPLVDGLQATAMIKADATLSQAPRIFLISSYRRDEIFKANPNAELVDAFLSKPISESRLFDAMAQVFDTRVASEPTEALPDLSKVRVLLAEDNKVNQLVAAGMLNKLGVAVTLAENGREAVSKLASDPDAYDLVFMDLEMPELDGFQATRAIRSGRDRPTIPIVALTAQAMRGDRERCLNSGMNAYLSKPIKPDALYQSLVQHLDLAAVHRTKH